MLPGAGHMVMAFEAAARIYNEFPETLGIKGFSLCDVAMKKSLVIPEDDCGIEVLTSMELVDAATAKSPAWATFSISSAGRETNEWTEHSTGLVQSEVVGEEVDVKQDVERLDKVDPSGLRRVDARAWNKNFSNVGLGYGPAFQPLSNIRTDPKSNRAVATVALHPTASAGAIKGGGSRYFLHPASLDGAIQLGLIACHGGRPN